MTSAPRAFPMTTTVSDQGRVTIGGCDLLEIAREFGTPSYVVDEQDFRARARDPMWSPSPG